MSEVIQKRDWNSIVGISPLFLMNKIYLSQLSQFRNCLKTDKSSWGGVVSKYECCKLLSVQLNTSVHTDTHTEATAGYQVFSLRQSLTDPRLVITDF